MRAPRRCACASVSRTRMPAPSAQTKPPRPAGAGGAGGVREGLRHEEGVKAAAALLDDRAHGLVVFREAAVAVAEEDAGARPVLFLDAEAGVLDGHLGGGDRKPAEGRPAARPP